MSKIDVDFVKTRLKMKMCPVCLDHNKSNFTISEDLTHIPIYSKEAIPDDLIEAYSVVCKKCGHIQLFAKSVLDGLNPEPNDPIEKS